MKNFEHHSDDEEIWDSIKGNIDINQIITEEQLVYMALDTISWAQDVSGRLHSEGAITASKILAAKAYKALYKEKAKLSSKSISEQMDLMLTDHVLNKMVFDGLIDEDFDTGIMTISEKGKEMIQKWFGFTDFPFDINASKKNKEE